MLVALRFWPHDPLSHQIPQSRAVFAADGTLLRLTLASDGQYRLWQTRKQWPSHFIDAILLQEDQHFFYHPGVNPVSLVRGAWSTYSGGARLGGSTITMQLARLYYRLETRDPIGKLKQIAYALWLEARYSKDEILEAYINLAPFGGNIQGISAASLIYFNKPPQEMTLAESLTLAVIPQQPNQRQGRGQMLNDARQRLLQRWRDVYPNRAKPLADFDVGIQGRERKHLPFLAPHFVEQLLPQMRDGEQLITTLDSKLQRMLERQIQQHLVQWQKRGVRNAVALLVDSRDQAVKAYVGSANYFDNTIAGQVNGITAKRSPGSTLKPFIYALAMDQGVIHPLSMLKDAATAFGPYTPENFDGQFAGPLSARDALNRSRNVPAVWLATQLHQPDLHDLLRVSGVSDLKSRKHYGLALVLGGGEVTMEELSRLYLMLANRGELKNLRYRADEKVGSSTRLLSAEASWLTLDMLAQHRRPDGLPRTSNQSWLAAWKTGTSWGFRDAWTAGVIGPYVLTVWLGNFDGEMNPSLIGIDAAAPLWWRIADALPLVTNAREPNRLPPLGVTKVEICSASGELPNVWCPKVEEGWFIPGKSPIRVSSLHQPVWIDSRTGNAVCPPYDKFAKQEIFEFWPSDLAHLFRQAGLPRKPPPSAAQCSGELPIVVSDAPRILSPIDGLRYQLRDSHPDETLALNAATAAESNAVFWFVDKSFLGRSKPGIALPWRPEKNGQYTLTVTDDRGRSTSRNIEVERID